MKRNKFFWIVTSVVVLFIFIASGRSANAQSKDRDNPTRLTSNEISGVIDSDDLGIDYFYTFVAGPGEVSITLTVEAARENRLISSIIVDLFDRNAKKIASKDVSASTGRTEQAVGRINLTQRQPLLLRINISEINYGGNGKYRIRLDGAVDFGPNTREGKTGGITGKMIDLALEGRTSDTECLPKKGILMVKMKDGSVKRIDLSQAKEITVEH